MVKLSILDYAARDEGKSPSQAFQDTTELAQLADRLGYHRFWVAEHHNVPLLAISAPEILMAHLASHTKNIRIGSGGVMLTNYSTYKVAEIFKTLEALYPNRIDAGVGNSIGADVVTHKAVTEGRSGGPRYGNQLRDLKGYLTDQLPADHLFKTKRARPVNETYPEMFVLGASASHAPLAAELGSGFVYAHFIRPSLVTGQEVVASYRENFLSSPLSENGQGKVVLAVFALVGKDEQDAEEMISAYDLWQLQTEKRHSGSYMPTPVKAKGKNYTDAEKRIIRNNREKVVWGTCNQVKKELLKLKETYQADEILICPNAYSIDKRKQTIEEIAKVFTF